MIIIMTTIKKINKYNAIKTQKVPIFKTGKFAGKSYLEVIQMINLEIIYQVLTPLDMANLKNFIT